MLDLQYICDNLEAVATNCQNRGVSVDLARLAELRDARAIHITEIDGTRHAQKEVSAGIPKADAETRPGLVEQGKVLREKVSTLEAELKTIEAELRELQSCIPNMTHPDAPVGKDDTANRTVRTWGTPPKFDFEPLDHVALMDRHDLLDLESAAKVTGHGFYFLKNEGALLELALVQLAVQTIVRHGFSMRITPDLARAEVLEGTGYQPRGNETQIYSITGTDLCLVATAEITLGGSLKDQILEEKSLPILMGGLSHCFRTEAGAHGKATKGIYRVHQFTKVEMFAFTSPTLEASDEVHQKIVAIEEDIFQQLEIPYRVVDICTGDLGGPAYRKYDLEAWMPGRGEWGEVTSASNCTDFQARRLGTRCKSPEKKGTQYVHTLNGTAVAVTRAMIAVLENHQEADGSVRIPKALQPWMGKDRIG